jgi:CDGSH-type Zn-finger protein
MAVTVTVLRNGPLMVAKEGCELKDNQGRAIEGTGNGEPSDDFVFLCRCGNSKNKPFCDGSHMEVGFKG